MTRWPPSTSGGDEVTTATRVMRSDPVLAARRARGRIKNARRHANRPRAGRHVGEDDGTRTHDRPIANRHAVEDLCARAEPHALTHGDTCGFSGLLADR